MTSQGLLNCDEPLISKREKRRIQNSPALRQQAAPLEHARAPKDLDLPRSPQRLEAPHGSPPVRIRNKAADKPDGVEG